MKYSMSSGGGKDPAVYLFLKLTGLFLAHTIIATKISLNGAKNGPVYFAQMADIPKYDKACCVKHACYLPPISKCKLFK